MSLYLNDTPAFLYYISKYYLIFFILQQVGAEVSGFVRASVGRAPP